MKKTIILASAIILLAGITIRSFGQDADTLQGWHKGGVISLNMAQSSFTHWAAGGQNSVALNGLINLTANLAKGKSAWDNVLNIGYGKMIQKGSDLGWVKTDDRIDLQSKYGRKASEHWYWSALMSFRTQMDAGYNYPETATRISGFMAPAYLLFSLGMDYKPKPELSVYLSPVTSKNTIVRDNYLSSIGAFGVDPGSKFRPELGAYANIEFNKDDILKNVNLMMKIDLFSNYLKKPQNIDIGWETLIVLKVNEFISATINTNLLYDDDILVMIDETEGEPVMGRRVQFKEVIGVGLTYRFMK